MFVTGVLVVDGSATPWFPGDPTEWLAQIPPKTAPEIPEDFGTFLPSDPKMIRELDLARNDAEFKFVPSDAGNSALRRAKPRESRKTDPRTAAPPPGFSETRRPAR